MSHEIYVVSKSRGFKRQILQFELPAPPPPPRPLLRPSVPPKARAQGPLLRPAVPPKARARAQGLQGKVPPEALQVPKQFVRKFKCQKTLRNLGPPRPAMPVGLVRPPTAKKAAARARVVPTAVKSHAKGVAHVPAEDKRPSTVPVPAGPTESAVPASPVYIPPSSISGDEGHFGPKAPLGGPIRFPPS